MHAIFENDPRNRTVDAAHFLHAFCGEPDFVTGGADIARLHLQPHIFALHCVGIIDARDSKCGSERPEI